MGWAFEGRKVRIEMIGGEPWFVAGDVCECLRLGNPTETLKRLDADEQALISIEGLSRGNDMANVVNESGLYNLIMGSRKPEAKRFKLEAL
jgi:prophage antirepressor-like protein